MQTVQRARLRKAVGSTAGAATFIGAALVIVAFTGHAPQGSAIGMMAYGFSAVILGCVTLLGLAATEWA